MAKKKTEQADVTTPEMVPEMVPDPLMGTATEPRSHEATEGAEAALPDDPGDDGEVGKASESVLTIEQPYDVTNDRLRDIVDPAQACLERWTQKRVRALPDPAKMTPEARAAELAALEEEQAERAKLEAYYADEIKCANEAIREAHRLIAQATDDRRKLNQDRNWLLDRVRKLQKG